MVRMTMAQLSERIRRLEGERATWEFRRRAAIESAKSIVRQARAAGRENLTEVEDEETDKFLRQKQRAEAAIAEINADLAPLLRARDEEAGMAGVQEERVPTAAGRQVVQESRWVRRNDQKPATVGRGERFANHQIVADYAAGRALADQTVMGIHGSLGQFVRAMTTTSGSAVVPTVWAGDLIDRARNLSAVLRAGAEIVPMDAKTVQIGRLTTDPTAAFRAEGSTITASDPVFDNITLDAKTMSCLVVGSLEWFQDSDNVDEIVSNAIAQAMATQLDLVSLFGGVVAGGEGISLATPPNPRGILATLLAVAPSSVLGSGANGTTQTALSFWNEVVQTIFLPRTFNEEPNALLWNAKLAQQYAMAYDNTGQPLQPPPAVSEVQKFITNQIPSFTQGTNTTATDLFVGDFNQLLIGQRLDITIQTLTERYAENGQIGIVAHWRGDVALARPRAFAVYRYLKGA
jgi:HK97 family phage major capsid protein